VLSIAERGSLSGQVVEKKVDVESSDSNSSDQQSYIDLLPPAE
jgi:hypothetical protein